MITITKEFPDAAQGLHQLEACQGCQAEKTMFFDIETTGLSRERSFIYLIGGLILSHGKAHLIQWLGENKEEEPVLLDHFREFSRSYDTFVHYNGKRFDIPFVEYRSMKYDRDSIFSGKASLDLYELLQPCKSILKLERMRQPDLENFLDSNTSRAYTDGGSCIPLYRKFTKTKDPSLSQILLGHNQEDLLGLSRLVPLLHYRLFIQGNLKVQETCTKDGCLLCQCTLEHPLPQVISYSKEDCYFTAENTRVKFKIAMKEGRLRRRYEDYKSYYYLPGEDMAVHKSLGSYMDASLRLPATENTCYTWFPCTQEFLDSPGQVEDYLKSCLPYWTKQ